MSTTAIEEKRSELAPSIRALLDALRARIRQYVWVEGVANSAAWLGFAFWASLAVDWFFEPPVPVRVILLLGVIAVLLTIIVKFIARRAFVQLTDGNMATVLERRFPQLDDSLLTTVILDRRDPSHDGYNPKMFEITCEEAVKRIQSVRLGDVFNHAPLRQAILAAALLFVSIVLFGILSPQSFGLWTRRTLGFSDELWPRQCRLEMPEGFKNGVRKVARGADVEIIVRAVPIPGGKFTIPRDVEIRYQDEGGAHGRASMDRIGRADPEKDAYQEFTYTRRNVLSPIRFDIKGGDAVLNGLRVEVVESPKVENWVLDYEYPAYLGRAKRSDKVNVGAISIPQGTKVIVHGEANKPLERVQIDCVSDDVKTDKPAIFEGKQLSADRRQFAYSVASLEKDATLIITLFDADGIKSREAIRLGLVAVPDQPPQIAAQLDGIGMAITPKARIAIAGRVIDDYGIGKLWFEHGIEQQPISVTLIGKAAEKPSDAATERILDGQALEIEPFDLKPGKKFQVALKAADLCTLKNEPNIGSGEQWTLDVVTPEQLRAILESRELVLRQRFESIMQEMTETRDVLARAKMETAPASDSTSANTSGKMVPGGEAKSPIDKPSGDDKNHPEEKTAESVEKKATSEDKKPSSEENAKKASSGNEPGDDPGNTGGKTASPEEQLALLLFRVQGVSTNCLKSTQETLGLAESFDDIRKQLVNNRVDTEELKERLQSGIADPLRNISSEMLPELTRRLELLQTSLEQSKLEPELRYKAKAQVDAVLLAMQKVLDRMIELEDYNQLVELLRDVIKTQEQLRIQTEQRQKQKIRDLLKE